MTYSQKKFIRTQKAVIRATFSDIKKQEEMIADLYKKFSNQPIAPALSEGKKTEAKVEKKEVKKEGKKGEKKSANKKVKAK